jgi:hypothetical protein
LESIGFKIVGLSVMQTAFACVSLSLTPFAPQLIFSFGRFNPHRANTRLDVNKKSFGEFFATALQHNQIGKGGFAVSFYVLLLLKRNICDSRSADKSQGSQVAV